MLIFLDWFFFVFHAALTSFNLVGWIWKTTRRFHLLCIGLTFFSWIGLGVFYGFGYCPFTDWHWQVKRALGETNLPASYIEYYVDQVTARDFDSSMIDQWVLILALAALVLSVWLNGRDYHRRTSENRREL